MASVSLLTLENPVFVVYALCSTIVLLKTLFMAPLTGRQRSKHKSFSFPEDIKIAGLKSEVKPPHPDVERVRRCHLNDMENVFPFVFIGLFFVAINPSPAMAKVLFSTFTVCRVLHTIIFVNEIPQPARLLTFLGGLFANIFMGITIIIHLVPLCF